MKQTLWLYELECPHCHRLWQLNVRFVSLRCTCRRTFTMSEAKMLVSPDLHTASTPDPAMPAAKPA